MLPVQTVMIRYMVLVYRWGRGWLGAAGDWGGFAGGDVTGGGARRWVLAEAHSLWARKGPADEGPAGLNAKGCYILWEKHVHYFFCYMATSFSRFYGITPVRVFLPFFIKNCRIEKPSMNR